MFDRLYTLTIHHDALKEKVLVIRGDSSKPSLNIEFSSEMLCQGVLTGGMITIWGLSTEHIQQLSAIRRYDLSDNTTKFNYLTLAVGYRELGIGNHSAGWKEIVLGGVIAEAIPGPLPDRAIRISVLTNNTSLAYCPDETGVDGYQVARYINSTLSLYEWIVRSKNAISPEGSGGPAFILDKGLEDALQGQRTSLPIAASMDEFEKGCASHGIHMNVNTEFAQRDYKLLDEDAGANFFSASNPYSAVVTISSDQDFAIIGPQEVVSYISESTGMIGLPRSIQEGAEVNVVLKDVYHCGDFVRLQSNVFPNMSSTEKYEKNGIYKIVRNRVHGSFLGDDWTQTLTLYRGPKIVEG